VAEAIRVGMIPTINSMMVMGLVSLPGMMTGQILQGGAPTAAVKPLAAQPPVNSPPTLRPASFAAPW
jgi:hypothetical protein